jgi:hypothetical protein
MSDGQGRARTRRVAWAVAWLTTAAALGTAGTIAPPAFAAPTAPAASGGAQAVIVVLKDQLANRPADQAHLGARRSAAQSDQASVLRRLSGAKPTKVVGYTVGNAFAATVTAAQAAQLAADPAVASVVPDRAVSVVPPAQTAAGKAPAQSKRVQAAAAGSPVDPSACSSDAARPKLEPEALQTMNVRSEDPAAKTAAALGIDGSGVKVAYIADGINPANPGFRRTDGSSSVVDYQDFYGDGPNAPTSGAEAFGDASAISAQGNVVYDVADYANPAVVSYPGGHCYIKVVGVAPGADVVGLKAGSELLPNSAILQSIDYAVSVAKVDVINESFGANVYPDSSARNTIQLFNDNAVRAGVTVVASTGDAGITSTIGNPSTDPLVISAGASTDSRIYEQTGYALATAFGNGHWQDNNISSLSSAGITQDGRTIDVSAPGEGDWAVCDDSGNFTGCTSFGNPAHRFANIQSFGGTSQSAPFTAGTAALVLQAYRTTHAGRTPAPALVKKILTSTARDLGLRGDEQGTGVIDARAAVEAALTWPGASTAPVASPADAALAAKAATPTAAAAAATDLASNVAFSKDQLTLTGKTGKTVTGRFTVRNVGRQAQSVVASVRRSALLSSASQTLDVAAASGQTVAYPTTGAPWSYQKFTFAVPGGADELSSTIRWASGAAYGGAGPVVRLSLFAPDGTYAGNTRPQGAANPANYGLITLKRPAAGTWTGVLYTPVTGGFTGKVTATNQTFRSIPVGKVTPSTKRLQPGRSARITVKLPVPAVGGDTVYTASVGSSGGHQTAVPVVVRALVPTKGSGGFAGSITGGNARGNAPAETFSYAFDVPKGKRDLDVAVTLGSDPRYLLEGVLVDPRGEVQSAISNETGAGQGRTLQNTVAKPTAGRWRYVLVVESPVPGTALSEDFTGTVRFNRVRVKLSKLPGSVPRSTPTRATLTVTNQGRTAMVVQTDARLDRVSTQQLAPQFAGSTLSLPQDVEDLSQLPAYLVPPDTTKLTLSASTTSPAQVELGSPLGGIDVFGDLTRAQRGETVSTASVSEQRGTVGLGYWFPYVQQIGPFGDGGAPKATSVLTGTVVAKQFDPAVTSSTGDPFLSAVDPTADPGAPLVVAPGTTRTITVTITPAGARGSKVSGVLHLVTTPIGVAHLFNTTGEVVASLPYAYTVR